MDFPPKGSNLLELRKDRRMSKTQEGPGFALMGGLLLKMPFIKSLKTMSSKDKLKTDFNGISSEHL